MEDGRQITLHRLGAGRPILFLHGWAMHGGLFAAQHTALQHEFSLITPDLSSHGHSLGHGCRPTIEQNAQDVAQIIHRLDLKNLTIVGWSMGAMVAWSLLQDPSIRKRIDALVTIDMSPRIANDDNWQLGLSDGRRLRTTLRAAKAMRDDWASMVHRFVPRIFAPSANDNVRTAHQKHIHDIVRSATRLDPDKLSHLWESMAVADYRDFTKKIDVPWLVIHGAQSQLYKTETGEHLVTHAPNAELVIIPDAGHAPHLEHPARFNATLAHFVGALETTKINTRNAG